LVNWEVGAGRPLAANTVKAYKRQTAAYVAWLAGNADHADAFSGVVGAEAAVTAWRRHLMTSKAAPASINQALAAVTLLYAQAGLRITVKRARIPRPGEPDALTKTGQGRVERAAARRHRSAASTWPPGSMSAAPTTARCGPGNVAGSPSPGSPRSSWPSARTPESPDYAPTGSATPTPPACAKAAPTSPKSRHFSATPPSKPPPATSAPATPNRPPPSTASSSNQQGPLTSERWMAVTPSPQAR
jgi:hypothetical protein